MRNAAARGMVTMDTSVLRETISARQRLFLLYCSAMGTTMTAVGSTDMKTRVSLTPALRKGMGLTTRNVITGMIAMAMTVVVTFFLFSR